MKRLSDSEVILASMTPEEAREFNQGNKENTLIYRAAKAKAKRFLEEKKLADSPILKRNINKKVAKIPVIPPKPDMVNGHSDWNTEDWLESVDPGGWVDDKKVEADSLYEKYLELLKSGELLPGTTFQMFEKHYLDFDTDIISKIKKRVKDKKITEGLAAILGVSPDRI
jgi:hypothetical protein